MSRGSTEDARVNDRDERILKQFMSVKIGVFGKPDGSTSLTRLICFDPLFLVSIFGRSTFRLYSAAINFKTPKTVPEKQFKLSFVLLKVF